MSPSPQVEPDSGERSSGLRSRSALLAPAVLMLAALILSLSPLNAWLSRPLVDSQRRNLAPTSALHSVVVADIDEASLQQLQNQLGGWPYPHDVYALAVDALREAGAKAVVVDLLLADARDGESALVREILRPGAPVVLAVAGLVAQGGQRQDGGKPPTAGAQWGRWLMPTPALAAAARSRGALGVVTMPVDGDGQLRRLPLWHEVAGQRLPALPLATWQRLNPSAIAPGEASWQSPDKAWLELTPAAGVVPSIAFSQVMQSALQLQPRDELARQVQGRVVFIGASAVLADSVPTPAGQISGIETLAQAYAQLELGPTLHSALPGLDALLAALATLPLWISAWRGHVRPQRDMLWWLGCTSALAMALLLAQELHILVASAAAWLSLGIGGLWMLLVRQRELVNTQLQLRSNASAAEAANRAKSLFLANASHEIRTPMNALLGAAQLLERTPLNAAQAQYVRMFQDAGQNLQTLLNDLLDLSKIESGRLELHLRAFDLAACCERAVALVRPHAVQRGLQVPLHLDPQLPSWVMGDEQRLEQMLANLLVNGVKFTKHGWVSLAVSAQGQALQFEVSDTGIGLTPEHMGRIFEPFLQAQPGVSRAFGGTGLGLSIVRSLAQQMQGHISVSSQLGQGSTFTLVVHMPAAEAPTVPELLARNAALGFGTPGPLPPAALALAPTVHGDAPTRQDNAYGAPPQPWPVAQQAGAQAKAQVQVLAGAQLLLVEDNDINVQLFCAMLDDVPVHIEVAGDGLAALELLKTKRYDLVFADVQMPLMDGWQMTRTFRQFEQQQGLPRTPVVALTANAYEADVEESLRAGCDAHLAKPYQRQQLLQALQRWRRRPAQPTGSHSAASASGAASALPAATSADRSAVAPTPAVAPAVPPRLDEQPQAMHSRAAMQKLRVLNEADASERLGNMGLYLKALEHAGPFIEQWAGTYHHAANLGNQRQMLQLAHDLKSIAAMVGAEQLSATAGALELQLKVQGLAEPAKESHLRAQVLESVAELQDALEQAPHRLVALPLRP